MHACPSCQGDCDCEDLICAHLCIRFADEKNEIVDSEQPVITDEWDEAHDDE